MSNPRRSLIRTPRLRESAKPPSESKDALEHERDSCAG